MTARKRPPSETLLPLRAAKHPRLTEGPTHPRDKSVGHIEGTNYLFQVGMKILKLGYDKTIRAFLQGAPEPEDVILPQSPPDLAAPRPGPPPPPRRPSRLAIPSEFKSGARPQDAVSSDHRPFSASLPRRPSQRVPRVPPVEVQIPPAASSSSYAPQAIPPRLRRKSEPNGRACATVFPRPTEPNPTSSGSRPQVRLSTDLVKHVNGRKKYIAREHIFAKQHKAKVRETREKDMEDMEKALYERKRQGGFTGDYASFKSYLRYKARLERLQSPLAAFSPSASLTDLRHPISLEEEPLTKDFLQRAWEKADASLASPSPPKLDAPAFEKILTTQRARDEEIERRIRGPKFPTSLPPKDEAVVNELLSKTGVISKCERQEVNDKDLFRLRPSQWLNDEIINFYGQLIMSRAEASRNSVVNGKKKPLNVHYFNTFFWSKLEKEGYKKSKLSRWTKKIDIFSKDVILIPVNHSNSHWTAAAINFRRKRIESYDSMGMPRRNVFKRLREYLDAEHQDKRGEPFDFTNWEDYALEDTPQQENGFDCGVFTCQFLEALSRGEENFPFKQTNMPYLRRRMIWEIGKAKLRDDP